MRGYELHSIFPSEVRSRSFFARHIFGSRGLYKLAIGPALRTALRTKGVIYTSSLDWARLVAYFKACGIIRNRLVVRWAGLDTDLSAIAAGSCGGVADLRVLNQADVCLLASRVFCDQLEALLPQQAHKFEFWPTGVDIAFYRHFVSDELTEGIEHSLVAVGTDVKRDWTIPIGMAERGISVTLLTEDVRVPGIVELLPERRLKLKSLFKVGFSDWCGSWQEQDTGRLPLFPTISLGLYDRRNSRGTGETNTLR